ncbi:aminotransferase class III-fold pyridoxal phosphate-dependent enzyme [Mesorhizobium sp. M0815]|uniref:aminotransferase class III-fold pyridoxal phosphate-dependent enzyme n=1 Tax=Mesorhizobium sp. M0815 TaxID=2957005 RepID=UPI00333C7FF9
MIAFVDETVVGATAGAVPPSRIISSPSICDRYVALLILEVMCGMGRTGALHACEQEGIVPYLMTRWQGARRGCQSIGAVPPHL